MRGGDGWRMSRTLFRLEAEQRANNEKSNPKAEKHLEPPGAESGA